MIALVPKWAHHYEAFWKSIRVRNLWFIKLRYLAAVLLLAFLFIGELVIDLQFSEKQINAILICGFIILTYNFVIHRIREKVGETPGKFNCMHMSVVQMIIDLGILMFLVYYTGNLNSPLYMFFVFHMIIGSMIIVEPVVYALCIIIIVTFASVIMLDHYGILANHYIAGLFNSEPEQLLNYKIAFISVFSAMMLISVFLANTIARRLYLREQQLHESLIKLNEAEVAKQKYVMGLVHEIKTPVAAVQSLLDLILKKFLGPVEPPIEEKVAKARKRTDESIQLINNILRISQLKLLNEASSEDISIIKLVEDIKLQRKEAAASKNIELTNDITHAGQGTIRGDSVLLELAFSNLIGNAVKYTPADGKVKVSIRTDSDDMVITISDDGIGIPQKDLEKIYNQFYRASNLRGRKTEGSGLGLSLVKEIIERHKGNISITSPSDLGTEERPGTEVLINLPVDHTLIKDKKEDEDLIIEDDL